MSIAIKLLLSPIGLIEGDSLSFNAMGYWEGRGVGLVSVQKFWFVEQFGGIDYLPVRRRKLSLQLGKSVWEQEVSGEVELMSGNFRMCWRDTRNIHDDKGET